MPRRIGKQGRQSVFPLDRLDKRLQGGGEDGFTGAGGDHFVRVACENGKKLSAVRGLEMRAACANRKFTFTRGPAVPKVLHNFRA
jgi:hypothetical protein